MESPPSELTIDLPDDAATQAFAEDIAVRIATGDVIALSGGLGAGKTTFARALIRTAADEPALEVPSPTFTLVQTYPTRPPIAHFDLYRLSSPDEMEETGFDEAIRDGAALVEWPERAEGRLPAERLDIAFEMAGTGRRAIVTAGGTWPARLARSAAVRAFLTRSGWADADRRHLQGDASTRVYERIRQGGRRAVLMDWPAADAPAAGDRRAAFRAQDVKPFVAVGGALRAAGFSAPTLYAADLEGGFLLLEDFGDETIAPADVADPERYKTAIEVLATIHAWPRLGELLILGTGKNHKLPPFTAEAFAAEVELFTDWYLPHATGASLALAERAEYHTIWRDLIRRLERSEKGWVLLDFHSPNLLWLAERSGVQRIGIIDFQDMLSGPSAYDVVSLCQDARVTVPRALERTLRDLYVKGRLAIDGNFDQQGFFEAYAILAAERATKILGVFARLATHAGKPEYLRHIPRVREYLGRALAHPALSRYAQWCERHVPPEA